MAFNQLRDFVDLLETLPGELIRVEEEVSPVYETSAVLKEAAAREQSPVVLFENVRGYPGVRIVGNVLGSRRRLATAMNAAIHELNAEYLRRVEEPVRPALFGDGPAKEVVVKGDVDVMRHIPVMTYNEKDSAPFISSGVCIAKQPGTGKRSMGIHRLEVKGKNKLGILLASPPVASFYAEAEARGEPLEVAIAIGLDPLTTVSSVVHVAGAVDKFEIAGSLRQAPVELVKAETVDVEVPRNAEFVIEGRVLPNVREMNGPFGESSGYYMAFEAQVMEITAITHRRNPIYHVIEPWSGEVENIFFGAQAAIFRQLRELVPTVKDLTFIPGSIGGTLVICLKKTANGEAKRVLALALGMGSRVKRAIVVDDDVDIHNPREVEWALATRFQADEDLVMLRGTDAYIIDPSAKEGRLGTSLGFDATKPLGNPTSFEKIAAPQEYAEKARKILGRY